MTAPPAASASPIAEVLAECGARVTLADIDAERLAEGPARLSAAGCDVRTAVVDVTDDASVRAAFAGAVAAHGGLDIVFANAGHRRRARLREPRRAGAPHRRPTTPGARVLGVNLDGVLSTMRAAAGVMKPQGSGRIVVTASTAGLRADPMVCYGYAASKAAVVNIAQPGGARARAARRARQRDRARARSRRASAAASRPSREQQWSALVPLGRMGEPEELKGLALMLASPASSFITGAVITIDGGQLLGEPGGW